MILELTDPTEGSTEPGRCWTQTNISEACPAVMTPLCWTVWIRTTQIALRRCWYDFGLVPKSFLALETDQNKLSSGCFYGRQAINVDAVREIVALAPGGSPDDFERDIFGYVRENAPPVRRSLRRYPFVAVRAPRAVLRQRRTLQAMHDEQLAWWRAEVLGETPTLRPRELLRAATARFDQAMHLHAYTRVGLLPAVQAPLTRLAVGIGGPALATRLLGGLGNTVETAISDDLWQLSRGRLTITEFVRRHGFHGPMEGNPVSVSWREDPRPVEALARVYARRPEADAPREREKSAAQAHRQAAAELFAGLPRSRRRPATLMLRVLAAQIRCLGLGKAAFLMGIDGTRAATRRIGTELVDEGITNDPDDAFYLTVDELLGPVPENVAEVVAFRRARRAEYESMTLPVTWHGMPTPQRAGGAAAPVDVGGGGVLTGAAGSGGVAVGRVRVVHDPLEGDDLEPGEVLVCRLTDPSWAALFPLAEAVVIDIGGSASHGAVVARELGIPCVIGTEHGTRVLRTGDLVRVDGDRGLVEAVPAGAVR